MKVFVSAAEISSDIQAEACVSALLEKLKQKHGDVEIAGVGGPKLRTLEGFQCIEQAENLRAMGFVEVLGKIFKIRAIQNRLVKFIKAYEPDLLITFDYPDFHLGMMGRLPKLKGTLKICAIPPKVWVWRQGRVAKIKSRYDGVLVIFPFEKEFYQSHGVPVIYEGNPLAAALPFDLSQEDALKRLYCAHHVIEGYYPLSVFPGSREGEFKYHLPVVAPTLKMTAEKLGKKILALVPLAPGANIKRVRKMLPDSESVMYKIVEGHSYECLRASQVGLIKSGTSTLEAALLGIYPVIFYKANLLSEWIFRLVVRYLGPVGLPNILLRTPEKLKLTFPELLGPAANPGDLSEALVKAIQQRNDPEAAASFAQDSLKLKQMLVPHPHVPAQIAQEIMKWLVQRPVNPEKSPSSFFKKIASMVWSSLNFIRRRIVFFTGGPKKLPIGPSILIGNLQAGGSGKTPVIKAFAKDAIEKGQQVAILTRGYAGKKSAQAALILPGQERVSAREMGDEVAELQQALPQALIAVGSDRVKNAEKILEWAKGENRKIDLVFLDDGFQNLKFKSDYTILCVSDQSPSQTVYRDFFSEAKFADLVIGTKGEDFAGYEKYCKNFVKLGWTADSLPTLPIFLLCAVGDPREVKNYYQGLGVRIEESYLLPDHSEFKAEEVKKLIVDAAFSGALVAVTEKDFVKLKELGFSEYDEPISALIKPSAEKIAVLRRQADVKELFKRVLGR